MESILQMGKERLGEVRRPPQDHRVSQLSSRASHPAGPMPKFFLSFHTLYSLEQHPLSLYHKQHMVFVLTRG